MKNYRMKTFDGELIIDDKNIVISHNGVIPAINGYGGTKSIPINSVESVSFIKCMGFMNGMMRFNTVGDSGSFPSKIDLNTVVFKKNEQELAIQIKNDITALINKKTDVTNLNQNNIEEIKKYKNLLDSGIITHEEFDIKKKELLGL